MFRSTLILSLFVICAVLYCPAANPIYPCGGLASWSVSGVLGAVEVKPGVVGGTTGKRKEEITQSMIATLFYFACPDDFVGRLEENTSVAQQWIDDFPDLLLRDAPEQSLIFLKSIGSQAPELKHLNNNEAAIASALQSSFRAQLMHKPAAKPRPVCGQAAEIVIDKLGADTKEGSNADFELREAQITALLGSCPREVMRAMHQDLALLNIWTDDLQGGLFDVMPEAKPDTEQERTEIIKYLGALHVSPELRPTLQRIRKAFLQTKVRAID